MKIDGNTIAFVESRQLGEREMRISYKGELKGTNLALTRSLGQRGDQESIATRELPKPQVENPARGGRRQNRSRDQGCFQGQVPHRHGWRSASRYSEQELKLAAEHFGAITPENCMKHERIHPTEDRWILLSRMRWSSGLRRTE